MLAQSALSSAAHADRPDREPLALPASFLFKDTLGNDPCGFPVEATVLTNNVVVKTFTRRDGTTVTSFTGALKIRLTNTRTGESVERNISGPTRLTTEQDGSVTQVSGGRGIFAFDPGIAPSLPRLVLVKGRTTSTFTPEFTFLTQRGSFEDLCGTLNS
jgi:hypothetical protein